MEEELLIHQLGLCWREDDEWADELGLEEGLGVVVEGLGESVWAEAAHNYLQLGLVVGSCFVEEEVERRLMVVEEEDLNLREAVEEVALNFESVVEVVGRFCYLVVAEVAAFHRPLEEVLVY